MIVDSSAILAILKREPEAEACLDALESDPDHRMSAATYLDASLVVDNSLNPAFSTRFDELMLEHGVIIDPVTESQARLARLAHRRFGRGNDSKAKLNFGDCFAYALARERNEPPSSPATISITPTSGPPSNPDHHPLQPFGPSRRLLS